jgi:hypothetical protein
MVLGFRVFGRRLGMRGECTLKGISALIKEISGRPSLLMPLKDIARRLPSVNQEGGPHQTPNIP